MAHRGKPDYRRSGERAYWHEIGAANERLGDEPRAIGAYWHAIEFAKFAGDAGHSTALASLWKLGTIYLKHREYVGLDRYSTLSTSSRGMPGGGTADALYRSGSGYFSTPPTDYREAGSPL